jgi:hypothetical protein
MPWVSPGCWIASNLTIMNIQTPQSALTEEVSKNNGPKLQNAKQIFLGIEKQKNRCQLDWRDGSETDY